MIRNKHQWKIACLLVVAATLMACTQPKPGITPGKDVITVPEAAPSEQETVRYYIDKLPDRNYVKTYGDAENPRPWYTAAEALGKIGKPAIPALIPRLDTQDPYELMLALYALMLASQDSDLQAETNGDYLRLGTVLTEDTNKENRRLALEWWQRYQYLWQ